MLAAARWRANLTHIPTMKAHQVSQDNNSGRSPQPDTKIRHTQLEQQLSRRIQRLAISHCHVRGGAIFSLAFVAHRAIVEYRSGHS